MVLSTDHAIVRGSPQRKVGNDRNRVLLPKLLKQCQYPWTLFSFIMTPLSLLCNYCTAFIFRNKLFVLNCPCCPRAETYPRLIPTTPVRRGKRLFHSSVVHPLQAELNSHFYPAPQCRHHPRLRSNHRSPKPDDDDNNEDDDDDDNDEYD